LLALAWLSTQKSIYKHTESDLRPPPCFGDLWTSWTSIARDMKLSKPKTTSQASSSLVFEGFMGLVEVLQPQSLGVASASSVISNGTIAIPHSDCKSYIHTGRERIERYCTTWKLETCHSWSGQRRAYPTVSDYVPVWVVVPIIRLTDPAPTLVAASSFGNAMSLFGTVTMNTLRLHLVCRYQFLAVAH
jgi:hypothetical protein